MISLLDYLGSHENTEMMSAKCQSQCCTGVKVLLASERLMAPLRQVLTTLRRGLLE